MISSNPLSGVFLPRKRLALHFFIELEQTLARQIGLGLQHLQAGTQLDKFNSQTNVPGL